MEGLHLKSRIGKSLKVLSTVAVIIGSVSAIAAVYAAYVNYIWKPTVKIDAVNWDAGVANISLGRSGSKKRVLYGDIVLSTGNSYGLRFSKDPDSTASGYSRIELIRDYKVDQIIATKQ